MRDCVDSRRPAARSQRVEAEAARAAAARRARLLAAGDDAPPAPAPRAGLASLHGLKYCYTCGACKARDPNAALNMGAGFEQLWNFGERPAYLIPENQLAAGSPALAARQAENAAVRARRRHRVG